ncbi:hypothetical protein FH972_018122 [Carpinus fangiana]|uniref:SecA Wing/Scaffold domain-containing protein n=1 Tax=Carpinus fangiana TaxID=176857 RepID=A0A5N6RP10_9ROSI|nr:hypothetical protein FH972_018122 [Carpinus fangiana]
MGGRGWSFAVTTILYALHPYSGGWWRLELHPADGGRSPPLCGDAKVSPLPHLCGVEIHHYKLKGAVGVAPPPPTSIGVEIHLHKGAVVDHPIEGEATHNCPFYGGGSPALQRWGWRSAPPAGGIDPTVDGGRSPPLCGDAKVSPLPHLCGVEIHHYKLKGAVGVAPPPPTSIGVEIHLHKGAVVDHPIEGEATHNCPFYGGGSPALQRWGWRSAPPAGGIDPTSTVPLHNDGRLLALQINVEKFFFGIRKSLVEFDEVLEVQRKHVYDLRQLILTGDSESCSQHILQYMQAVVDEIVCGNVDPLKHPRSWSLGKLLREFISIAGTLLDADGTFEDSFAEITEEALLDSIGQLHDFSSIDIDNFYLPKLPKPPNSFRGVRKKSSSLKRWLSICSDDLTTILWGVQMMLFYGHVTSALDWLKFTYKITSFVLAVACLSFELMFKPSFIPHSREFCCSRILGRQEPKGVQDNVDPDDQRFGPNNLVNSEKWGFHKGLAIKRFSSSSA